MKKNKILLPLTAMALLLSFGLAACNNASGQSTPADQSGEPAESKAEGTLKIAAAEGKKNIIINETVQLSVTDKEGNAVTGVKFESDAPAIASVNETGLVTGLTKGSATIAATKDGYKAATIKITVDLPSIKITAPATSVVIGQNIQLSADVQGVTWKSSAEAIATVDNTGKVTGVKAGSATISAEKDGYNAGSVSITVDRPEALATLHFEDADHYSADGWWGSGSSGPGATPIYSSSSGNASDGTCLAYFDNGDKETLSFTSSAAIKAELVVTMRTGNGYSSSGDLSTVETVKFNNTPIDLTGITCESSSFEEISLGEVNIIAGDNALEFAFLGSAPYLDDLSIYSMQQAIIALKAAPTRDTIAVENAELSVEQGKTVQINVTNATGVTFSSDKEDIATVDATGLITGVSMGSANIIVKKDGMYSAKVKVTVNEVMAGGEIRLEAELAEEVVAGSSSFMNLTDSTSGITRAHSGGGYISGYNVSGEETLTFKFNAEAGQAGKYTLSVNGSPAYGITTDFMFKESTTITFNTAEVNVNADAKIAAGDGSMSAPRVDADLGEVTVVAGENTLVVVFHGSAPSLDFFRLVPKA